MSPVERRSGGHAELMDGIYRHQRHFYDLTRKYYLLGRDRLVTQLAVPQGGTVLELGCGTGRNLAKALKAYPHVRFFGLDISAEMLDTAAAKFRKDGFGDRVRLARGDASGFSPQALFDRQNFDRIFISYALSMIPEWQRTVRAALAVLKPGGTLHIVDFGRQQELPGWLRRLLRGWLKKFHVTPRDTLCAVLESECERIGATVRFEQLYRGYAVSAVITRPV
jgi:S-adenosylmethionine-diacylgycerolhomoserine-N-methlytransferase